MSLKSGVYEFQTELGRVEIRAASKEEAKEKLDLLVCQIDVAAKLVELGYYAIELSWERANAVLKQKDEAKH